MQGGADAPQAQAQPAKTTAVRVAHHRPRYLPAVPTTTTISHSKSAKKRVFYKPCFFLFKRSHTNLIVDSDVWILIYLLWSKKKIVCLKTSRSSHLHRRNHWHDAGCPDGELKPFNFRALTQQIPELGKFDIELFLRFFRPADWFVQHAPRCLDKVGGNDPR